MARVKSKPVAADAIPGADMSAQDIQNQHRSWKQERALARKEKKKHKSHAKKARKKTASSVGMWSAERKAADKAKKPKGVEKLKLQRDKLKTKAGRLEQEGLALLAQAKQAVADYEALNEKIESSQQEGQSKLNKDKSTSSSDDAVANDGNFVIDVTGAKNKTKTKTKSKDKTKKPKKNKVVTPDESESEADLSESSVEESNPTKKRKVEESESDSTSSSSSSSSSSDSSSDEEPKKKVENPKKAAPVIKEKKDKSKKSKTGTDAEAEQWNVAELEGGSARQSKFMRLLGGKKAGVSNGATHGTTNEKSSSTKAEAEIRRQFEAGMKMKEDGGNRRRGLGA